MKKKRFNSKLDVKKLVDEYIKQAKWEIRENANLSYSFSSVFFKLAGESMTRYALTKVYPKKIASAHLNGDLHLHNLYMGIVPYCAGWSIADILLKGFGGVAFKTDSAPPKHFSTALLQLTNFVGTIQNEWAGAQAFNSLDTYLAPFIRADKLKYKEVKQQMQQFIYNLNISSRWGGQTPFTNITFDLKVPKDLKNQPAIIGGKLTNTNYSDYQDEVDMLNKAFIEVLTEGDTKGRVFTFPIPTYNITKNFDWDSDVSDALFRMTAKFGSPYFQNFVNSDLDPREVRSMCCRLRLDLRQFYRRMGGFFGYADKTGSVGVVTINLPRIAYLSNNEKKFFERLDYLMEIAKDSLEIKRRLVEENINKGLLPFSKIYLGSLKWHFATIGIVGGHEACLNFLGKGIETEEGKAFAIKILKHMLKRLKEFQKETGHIYNLEATPAESTAYRLARIDKKRYPKIKTSGEKEPYYTNSTFLPVDYTDDMFEALEHQNDLQPLYTGGTVFHGFVGERVPDPESCKQLVKKIAYKFKIPYYTITPTFSICPSHGYFPGEKKRCPICKKPCEIYSRIVGYYRPIQNWNKGKQEEFRQRKNYIVRSKWFK